MDPQDAVPGYHTWGIDNTAYGPVELPALVDWIRDERVLANTWLFVERDNGWFKAADVPELKMFFRQKKYPHAQSKHAEAEQITPAALRRIKAFAEMTDEQLTSLLGFIEVVRVRPFTHLVRKGEPGDAMLGVVEGEVRSCISVAGKECMLATLGPGAVFGEISLFDKGPHAADIISNEESLLVKISADAVANISREAPEAALAMLMGLIKAIAGRVRTLTKRYEDSVQVARRAEPVIA
jgi:CRP-like cAMP-binding protein